MAALAADAEQATRTKTREATEVATADVVYAGALPVIKGEAHATTAEIGLLGPTLNAAGEIPIGGIAQLPAVTGDGLGAGDKEQTYSGQGEVVERVTVTGVTAITDQGKVIYATSDNVDDFSLTRPTRGLVRGRITRWHSGTICDVELFSTEVLYALGLGGGARQLVNLGSFDATLAASANYRTAIEMHGHGKIIEVFAMIDVVIAGTGASVTVNLELDGVNVTGGVVTLAESDARATKKAGTAVTALNVFHEGTILDVEGVVGTAITSGRFDLFMVTENQPGL